MTPAPSTPRFKVGQWVMTPAGERLQVRALIIVYNNSRYLLSNQLTYAENALKSAE
jgi:hypothetical protein